MVKINKDFFTDGEILFVGYSSRNKAYSNSVLQAFNNANIKVYPYNKKGDGSYDIKVYHKLEELPEIPRTAYILLNKQNTKEAINLLIENGVNKLLLYSKNSIEPDTLSKCEKAGVEVAYGCPLMLYGSGFHKIHAFFAGVK